MRFLRTVSNLGNVYSERVFLIRHQWHAPILVFHDQNMVFHRKCLYRLQDFGETQEWRSKFEKQNIRITNNKIFVSQITK